MNKIPSRNLQVVGISPKLKKCDSFLTSIKFPYTLTSKIRISIVNKNKVKTYRDEIRQQSTCTITPTKTTTTENYHSVRDLSINHKPKLHSINGKLNLFHFSSIKKTE